MTSTEQQLQDAKAAARRALIAKRLQGKGGAEPARDGPVPRPVGAPAVVSSTQQRLWFLDQVEPGSPLYNLPCFVRWRGPLHEDALRAALRDVVVRHEALRTTFVDDDGAPRAVVTSPPSLPMWVPALLPRVDLSTLPAAEREGALLLQVREAATRPFDLAAGPLWRAPLVRLDHDDHALLLCLHHIVTDGWSSGVLLRELSERYRLHVEAMGTGAVVPPPAALPFQFADHAAWLRERQARPAFAASLAHWAETLAGAPALLTLPTDRPRPRTQSFRGQAAPLCFDATLSNALRRHADGEQASLYMLLLASFQHVLGRHAGQDDVVVGCPMAARAPRAAEDLIGFFANTVPLRTSLAGRPTFRQLWGRAKRTCLAALEHQEVPLDQIVARARPAHGLGENPLFQALLVVQNAPFGALSLPGVELSPLPTDTGTAKFDVVVSLEETSAGLRGSVEWNADLFDATTVARWMERLELVLRAGVDDPDGVVDDVELFTRAERQGGAGAHLGLLRGEPAAAKQSARAAIWDHAARVPDAVAVKGLASSGAPEAWSYARLIEEAERLAAGLVDRGVGPDDVVALALPRSPAAIAALLACHAAGAAFVFLDDKSPAARRRAMVQDAQVRLVVVEEAGAGAGGGDALDAGVPVWSLAALRATAGLTSLVPLCAEQLAYVTFTSGSTGRPKGVALPQRALSNLCAWQARVSTAGPGTRTLQFAALPFDVSVQEIFSTLTTGGTLVLVDDAERADPSALLRRLQKDRIERLYVPMVALQALAVAAAEAGACASLPALREIAAGGEQLQVTTAVRALLAQNPQCHLHNHYGPSETHACAFWQQGGSAASLPALPPIGQALDGAHLQLLDGRLRPVPRGVPGQLYAGGDVVGRGYVGRPAATAERFVPDPAGPPGSRRYATGDLARVREDGLLECLGRTDHQVKVRGHRVEPGDVEAALLRHPAVAACAVVPKRNGLASDETTLVGYVVFSRAVEPVDLETLRRWLLTSLPPYMVPAQLVALPALPRTGTGKLDRLALPEPPAAAAHASADDEALTPLEQRVARVWHELLPASTPRRDDNFFERGGHSLSATRLVARLRQETGVALPLQTVFERPTLRGLAAALGDAAGATGSAVEVVDDAAIARVPRTGKPVAASFAQRRFWFLDQFEAGSAFYTMHLSVELQGALDRRALERALSALWRRQESLRTRLIDEDGAPALAFLDTPAPPLTTLELRSEAEQMGKTQGQAEGIGQFGAVSAADRRAAVTAAVQRFVDEPFDLARGPLFRALCCVLDADTTVLCCAFHHAIGDGASLTILQRELLTLYAAARRGVPDLDTVLPPLLVQVADVAAHQHGPRADARFAAERAAWLERLRGPLPVLQLPSDRPRPARQRYRGDTFSVSLGDDVRAGLTALSARTGATPFMVLAAAYVALLSRLSHQRDILVGTPVSGRSSPALEDVVGCFVNTVVLRAAVDLNAPFASLLQQMKDTSLRAYAHASLPFEALVEALQPPRSPQHSPVFQAFIVHHEFGSVDAGTVADAGLSVKPFAVGGATSTFDLTFTFLQSESALHLDVEYDVDLFDRETAQGFARAFQQLLRGALHDSARAVGALPLLAAPQRDRVLRALNPPEGAWAGACVHELIEAQARARPDAIAVEVGEVQLSYAAFDARANQVAHALRARGVGADRVVAVCAPRSVELYVGMVGVLKAGAAYLPLDDALPVERLRSMVSDADAALAIGGDVAVAVGQAVGVPTLSLYGAASEVAAAPTTPVDNTATPTNLAYVIYTSGSTGRPKGAMNEHRALSHFCAHAQSSYGYGPSDRVLQFSSVSWDVASVEEIFPALTSGATLVGRPPSMLDAHDGFWDAIAALRLTVVDLPTAFWNEVCASLPAAGRMPPSSLRLLITGGERAAPQRVGEWHERLLRAVPLQNTYGVSESTSVSAHATLSAVDATREPPVGRPLPRTQVYVLDARLEPVPQGVVGEIFLGGAGLGRGYLNNRALTAERFVPHPFSTLPGARLYRTGDLGRLRADGNLVHCGRADAQVKVRGHRVELAEIEAAVCADARVRDCAVVVDEASRVIAYVVPRPADLDVASVQHGVAQRVPPYMVPAAFVLLGALPMTPTGKLDRRALPAAQFVGAAHSEPPATDDERALARLWCALLRRDAVGRDDDFFALGGHSLLCVQLLGRVRAELARNLPLASVFGASTLRAMASAIAAAPLVPSSSSPPKTSLPSTRAAAPTSPTPNVVTLRRGEGPPLVLVHPWEGAVLCYRGLLDHLPRGRTVLSLQAPGLEPGEAPLSRVEELAALYLPQVRAAWSGPLHLGGWSMGGIIALEMAQRLRSDRSEGADAVLSLTLVDSSPPATGPGARSDVDSRYTELLVLLRVAGDTDFADERALQAAFGDVESAERAVAARVQARLAGVFALDADTLSRLRAVLRAHDHALTHYTPRDPYAAPLHYVRATQSASAATVRAEWAPFAPQMTLHSVEGDHRSLLFDPVACAAVARAFEAAAGLAPASRSASLLPSPP